jgi:hypothetical protein
MGDLLTITVQTVFAYCTKNKQSVQQELSTMQLYKKQQGQQEPFTQYNGTKTGARPITIHHVNVLKQYERKQELSTI